MDGSGLSVDDRLTAETLDETVNAAAGNDQPKLRPLVDLLPIAGGSGTLSNRFLNNDAERAAAGWLRAKTGSLTGTNSLVGIVTDASGRVLTFALHLQQRGPDRSHRHRRAGRDAAVVWVQHMSEACERIIGDGMRRPSLRGRRMSRSTKLNVGRAVDWGFAATVGAKLARPGPAATEYTRRQVIDQLASAALRAEMPVREVTGLTKAARCPTRESSTGPSGSGPPPSRCG